MDDSYEHGHQLRALAMRVAALEDNVAFLEQWCEEQQDLLDRAVGPVGYDYEVADPAPGPRAVLRVVDLRDGAAASVDDEDLQVPTDALVAMVETEHDRRVRQIRAQLNRLRSRLAESLAPPPDSPPADRRPAPPRARIQPASKLSAKPAGRTAP
jgi:hypothetical protein